MLEIQKFLKNENGGKFTNETILSTLQGPPWFINIKRHPKYPNLVQFTYDSIKSPKDDPIVIECRGIILDENDNWKVVVRRDRLSVLISEVSKIRLKMWPTSLEFNIDEVDHLLSTLLEEAGEFRGATRSVLGRQFNPEKMASKDHMIEEFGDMLVPIIALSKMTGITFESALDVAIEKLENRYQKYSMEEADKEYAYKYRGEQADLQ